MRTYIKRLTITLDPDPEDNENLTDEQVAALYDAAVERWDGQDAKPSKHRFRLTSATTVDLRESVWVNEDNLPDFTCESCDATATCEEYEANGCSALFRYLAGLVLPEVEREERVSRISVFRSPLSPHFEVARVTNHVRLGRTGMSAGDARALAACLLAAADEAEGGHQ